MGEFSSYHFGTKGISSEGCPFTRLLVPLWYEPPFSGESPLNLLLVHFRYEGSFGEGMPPFILPSYHFRYEGDLRKNPFSHLLRNIWYAETFSRAI